MKGYKDFVWQWSYKLSKAIYQLTALIHWKHRSGLVNQMERSAVSIMSNIAEGTMRTKQEWINVIRIASGSAVELECQLRLAKDLKHAPADKFLQAEEYLGHAAIRS